MDQRKLSEFILGCNLKKIRETVIMAPCWFPDSVGIINSELITAGSCKIWDCSIKENYFTYILTGVGACNCADTVMALSNTACKRIMFIGSAGSIDDTVCIGDIVFPENFVVGEGASRYLQTRLDKDVFGTVYSIEQKIYSELMECAKEHVSSLGVNCRSGNVISVESIFSQFRFIDYFIKLGCRYLDMESSSFVVATQRVGIEGIVCFCISDNVMNNQSLATVDETTTDFRKKVRRQIMPVILDKYVGFSMDSSNDK